MSYKVPLAAVGGALMLALGIGSWIAYAEGAHGQTRSNEEQIQKLTDLYEARVTAEQATEKAEEDTLRRLCQQGKLDPEDCRYLEDSE